MYRGVTVWLTGLSGAGKTTLSQALAKTLKSLGCKVEILDGDTIRQNLSQDLGFSKQDRNENVRRIGFVANLLTRNDIIAIVAAISPYRSARGEVRELIGDFVEIFVNAPIEVCAQRDPRGLYARSRDGMIPNFTGLDDPYEAPLHPEVECRTDLESLQESLDKILDKLGELNYLNVAVLPEKDNIIMDEILDFKEKSHGRVPKD
jgi:adenylylsulfate kinase